MATSSFPTLKILKEDIKKLLDDGYMKGFHRLTFQFYRQGDKFTLVAQLVDERGKKMDKTPVLFMVEDTSADPYNTDGDVMFLQHELNKNDVIRLSDNGKKDIILKPKKITVNPDGVTYEDLNPCPPNQPGGN